ncbi:hypothetical protein CF166_18975 [Amycolatopsis sp. KNN50.9b]|nr:hypothetical protein CF166_18975 [Amycolatopsis sp. KNN50.9b]
MRGERDGVVVGHRVPGVDEDEPAPGDELFVGVGARSAATAARRRPGSDSFYGATSGSAA